MSHPQSGLFVEGEGLEKTYATNPVLHFKSFKKSGQNIADKWACLMHHLLSFEENSLEFALLLAQIDLCIV